MPKTKSGAGMSRKESSNKNLRLNQRMMNAWKAPEETEKPQMK
jgi:hypothetical protein